jgi:hypothetical protein
MLGMAVCVARGQDFRSSLVVGPYSLSFGDVLVGKTSDSQTITLLNTGTTEAQVDKITTSGPFSQTNNCPVPPASLSKNDTCAVEVTFWPSMPGPASGMVTVFHNRSPDPIKVSLSGIGTVNPSSVRFSPDSLNFGEQKIGTTSAPQTITVESAGQTPLLISSISAEGDFTIMPASTCESLIGSLAPAGNCTVVVTFTPLGSGKRDGGIVFKDDAEGSPHRVPLSGIGKDP